MALKSKFIHRPRSMADLSALRDMADAINALRNGSIPGGRVFYGDGNTIWTFPSSSGASLFTVVSDGGDFMVCIQNSSNSDVNFTPATGGVQVNVYKPWKLRTSLSTETINGVVFDYTYVPNGSPVSFYTRNWTGSDGSSGSDYVESFYLPNDPIWAVQDSEGNWVDDNRNGRAWATFQQTPPP
jgi:hypothetical protein